jgi:hypothetical protein
MSNTLNNTNNSQSKDYSTINTNKFDRFAKLSEKISQIQVKFLLIDQIHNFIF